MKDEFLRRFNIPAWKVNVIPHGVDTSKFKPIGEKEERSFVFVGRFVEDKDPLSCIKAAEILIKKFEDVKVYMIGAGALLNVAKKLVCKYRLNNAVKFLGAVKNEDLPMYYSKALASISPRVPGMVLLESLACGTPVIAGNINMAPEIIDENCGYLIPASDSKALAEAMAKICCLKTRELEKMALCARVKAEKFDWSIIAKKAEEVYERAINSIL
jgi:D-inositol-3-phosphate glycosyltransferase